MVGRREALARWPWLTAVPWSAVAARFPVGLARAYLAGAVDRDDPRLRTALPDVAELEARADDLEDPVGDARMSPVPWVVRKHHDRVLLLLTKRCHVYCRYCFRRDHKPGASTDPSPDEWRSMLAYASASGAREAILSGGDPLAIHDARLFEAIDGVRPVPVVRVHSRAPITFPARVTPHLVRGLRSRAPLWVVVHANHVAELTPEVERALGLLVDGGLPVLNQAVLLRGVNDSVDALADLCERLVSLRVFPYYLHHPDAAPGNGTFRLPIDEGLRLYAELRRRVSGVALPLYVRDDPEGAGKGPV
jgi:lysine 2,3-aminomutase